MTPHQGDARDTWYMCVRGVVSSQGVVMALHAHTSASAVIGTSGRARCRQDAWQGGGGADRPCWHQAQRWCGILERTSERRTNMSGLWGVLAAVGIYSVLQRDQTSERGSARRTSPTARRPPADAPPTGSPTGKRDPGDRAVRARAPRSAVCRLSECRCRARLLFTRVFLRAGLSRGVGRAGP